MAGSYTTVVHAHKLPKIAAIIIGIVLSVPVIFAGFYVFQMVTSRASNTVPHDVIVSEITATKAKINWTTDEDALSVIEYGTSPNALVFFAPETQKTRDHEIEIDLLTPRTTHYFQIKVGEESYDNGGTPWTFTTKSTGSAPDAPKVNPTLGPTGSVVKNVTMPTVSLAPTAAQNSCVETDCKKIQQKFGQGCSVSDYIRCLVKGNSAPTATPSGSTSSSSSSSGSTPTPTATPIQKADLTILTINNSNLCLLSTGSTARIKFSINVKNQGGANAGDNHLLFDFDQADNTDDEGDEYVEPIDFEGGIGANSSAIIAGEATMTSCTKCTTSYSTKLTIDKDDVIDEIDEDNNTYLKPNVMCSS